MATKKRAFIIILLAWLACAPINYGATMADFWYEFPRLQEDGAKYCRKNIGPAVAMALFGLVGLGVVALGSDFYRHGLMFVCPPRD